MSTIKLNEMIDTAMGKSRTLRGAMLAGYWEEIVGKAYNHSELMDFKEKIIYIKVGNSSFLHYMSMNKKKYIEKMNYFLKGDYVENIIFRLGKINLENKFKLEEMKKQHEEAKIEKIEIKDFQTEKMTLEESIDYLSKLSKEREEYALSKGYKRCIECKSIFMGSDETCPSCQGIPIQTVINKN